MKNGPAIESNELVLKIGTMGSTIDSKQLLESASNQHSDSVRLLADFRLSQGLSVMFPPISPQEAREHIRGDNIRRDFSKQQMMTIPGSQMRALQKSPSTLLNQSLLGRSPPGSQRKPVATHNNGGLKDPGSLVLNINRKFEKLTAFTTDGNKLPFYVHLTAKNSTKKTIRLQKNNTHSLPATSHKLTNKYEQHMRHQNAKLPATSRNQSLQMMGGSDSCENPSTAYLLLEGDQTFGPQRTQNKEEQTKSMKKYEKELQFKNRVLKEKEKAVYNQGMLKKLSQKQISTSDLKSERTLTNYRQSKK